MKDDAHCVMIFGSIHDVIAAEKALHAASLWCDMVPVPRELSSDCGMALLIRPVQLRDVRDLLSRCPVECDGIYKKEDGEYSVV